MNRRDFLRIGGAVVAMLSVPGWSEAFGQAAGRVVKPSEATLLRKSIELARYRGVPLIVLRAPADAVLREQLGEMWGAYLSLADSTEVPDGPARNARMIDLALCELVCATDADILRELPSVSALSERASCIALVVEPVDAHVGVLPGPVITLPFPKDKSDRDEARLHLMSELDARLHAAVAADLDMLNRRAHENYAALNAAQRESLAKIESDYEPGTWLIQAACAPGCLRLLVDKSTKMRIRATLALRQDTSARLDGTIRGSRWETAWWEHDTEVKPMEANLCTGGPCGMAFTPAPSVRFLRYFTESGKDVPPPAAPVK